METQKLTKFEFNDFPPVHPNCVCSIENGVWELGESMSGPCPICQMKAAQYNQDSEFSTAMTKAVDMLYEAHKSEAWLGYKRILMKSTLQEVLPEERADISIITTDSVDKEGDIVLADGMDWSDFMKIGGPVQYEHKSLQVGRALWVKPYNKANTNGWIAKTQYHKTEKGDEAYNLVKSGELVGKSIGGDWTEVVEPDAIQKACGARRIITKSKIYEFSICSVPANEDAKVIAKAEKQVEKPAVKTIVKAKPVVKVQRNVKAEIYKHLAKNFSVKDIIEISRGRI